MSKSINTKVINKTTKNSTKIIRLVFTALKQHYNNLVHLLFIGPYIHIVPIQVCVMAI